MTREELVGEADDEELMFLDPSTLDVAIIGATMPSPGRPSFVVYDYEKVIGVFMEDMPREEAEEFFEFNTLGSWVGARTPVFVRN